MADLKTNYVDDVLDTSVNEKRKYNMIQNADGTVSFDDVTTYAQNGDSFGAKDVNDTNTAVNELNNNLSNINVYVGEDEKLHFVDSTGADSVLPFSNIFEKNNVSVNKNATFRIDCGFRAKNIIIHGVNGSVVFETVYTESYNIYAYGGDGEAVRTQPTTSFIQVSNITDNGFDVTGSYWRDAMCDIIATQ